MAALASGKILPIRSAARVPARCPTHPTAWQLVTGEYLDHAPELPPERPADLNELVELSRELNDVHAMTLELHRRVTQTNLAQATENDHEQIPIARDNPRFGW